MTPARVVDAHVHFWDMSDPSRHPWMAAAAGDSDEQSFLRRDYLPSHYLRDIAGLPVEGVVHVEAGWDETAQLEETRWVAGLLAEAPFASAIVAGAHLQRPDVSTELAGQRHWPTVAGIRHMLDWDPTPGQELPPSLHDPNWEAGLQTLATHGLTFDLQVATDQLEAAVGLARRHPDVLFVLNHGGLREPLTSRVEELWQSALQGFAGLANVRVKVSGYANVDPSWEPEAFRRYVRRLLDAFGPQRCCFASNFPFDATTISFTELVALHEWALDSFSPTETDDYFAGTASSTYQLRGAR